MHPYSGWWIHEDNYLHEADTHGPVPQLQVTSPSNPQTFGCTHPHLQGTAVFHHSWRQEISTGTRPQCHESPEWALAPPSSSAKRPPSTNNNPQRPMLGLPYVAGLLEQLGRIDKSHNIHIYHKPANTLRSMVLHHKEKTPKEHRCGTIYNITCDIDSSHTYIENSQPEIQRTYKPG